MAKPDMMGIIVRDMAKALRFYRLLGLEIGAEQDNQPHAEVTLPGGFRVAWDSEAMMRGILPDWEWPATPQPALAFLCNSPAEVDSLYAEVVAAGYSGYKEPWDAVWGQRYAVVLDPDGHLIDLFAWQPQAA